ncbi:hypothetical protein [Sphingobium vermicomposti]|uniref:Uncharacterized protein n=1 Tax=Sphingobium vermicomposti TaxID=529005 RepID=A0A846M3L3_9SPHN|nr:hypothetical protein [Sphingobium vermicomposti]NIJ16502.1 hypothetical protein [Sphingobium vermicomposti]
MADLIPADLLTRVDALTQPFDCGALDAAELSPHCSFQHYDPVIVIDRADAQQGGKHFIGAKGCFDNPM